MPELPPVTTATLPTGQLLPRLQHNAATILPAIIAALAPNNQDLGS
jgi:hypothetical protein